MRTERKRWTIQGYMDCSEELGLYSKSCTSNKYHKQGQKANAKLRDNFQTEVKDFLP